MTLFVSDQLSFSIQSGDQQYEETEQQIRRIGRQKAVDGKIVAVHKEKLWNMVQIEKGRRRGAQKERLEDQHGSQGQISRGKV